MDNIKWTIKIGRLSQRFIYCMHCIRPYQKPINVGYAEPMSLYENDLSPLNKMMWCDIRQMSGCI